MFFEGPSAANEGRGVSVKKQLIREAATSIVGHKIQLPVDDSGKGRAEMATPPE